MKRFLLFCLLLAAATACGRSELEVWSHPYLKPMDRQEPPSLQRSMRIELVVTPGEYEPAAFAARALNSMDVSVTLEEGKGGNAIRSDWWELHRVVSLSDSTAPNRLIGIDNPVAMSDSLTNFFWLTVRPPEDTPPGVYTGNVRLEAGSSISRLPIFCKVLEFTLEPATVTAGVFMASTDLPGSWYKDMKEHGLDAIQMFWGSTGIDIRNEGGKLVLGFDRQDELLEKMTAAGMDGPVVISLGNDHSLHYETRLARAFGLTVDTSEVIDGKAIIGPPVSKKLDELYLEGLRQIREHWDKMGWRQELVVLIYDEPTERLLERCKNRYDLLKTVMPETRVYGVVMNRRAWAESMLDQMDIVVSDGDFLGCLDVARDNGKDYWVYSFPMRGVHTARYDMGALPWRVEASGTFFWMYNYWSYNPDGCAVYRHPESRERLVRSTPWEGVREAVDDLRYFATAEKLIEQAQGDLKAVALESLAALRESIDPTRRRPVPLGDAHDEVSVLSHYNEPQIIRDRVIELILSLKKTN